jgi:predicted permease
MPLVPGFRRNFRFPWQSSEQIRNDVDEEIHFHLDMRAEELEATGLSPSDALEQARREFGDVERTRSELGERATGHENRRQRWMIGDEVAHDVRFALRNLRRSPGFAAVAVVVLALGIGANAAMFTLINTLLLRPSTASEPERIVGIFSRSTERPDTYRQFSYPLYRDIRSAATRFSHVAAHGIAMVGLGEGEITRRVMASVIGDGYFDTFGVTPVVGRGFTESEARAGSGEAVAILSHRLWQRRGASDRILEETVAINGRDYRVVGVAPPGFTGPTSLYSADIFVPFGVWEHTINSFIDDTGRNLDDRDNHALFMVARLAPGVDADLADVELATLAARLAAAYPDSDADFSFSVAPLSRFGISTRPSIDEPFAAAAPLLMGMAGVVLLIACLNLANMLLAKGAGRRTEMALRGALGGGRARLLRQLLTEGVVLSLLGGVAGLLVALWATRALATSILGLLPFGVLVFDTAPDARVLAATLAFCLLATLFFALGPALRLTRTDLVHDIKQSATGSHGAGMGRALRSRNLLVVGQIALSLCLLTAGGLFLRGALRAADTDPGFELGGMLLAELDPSLVGYDESRGRAAYGEITRRLREMPEVEAVGLSSLVPFGAMSDSRRVRRASESDPEASVSAVYYVVSDGYFDALRMAVLQGRDFGPADRNAASRAPIVIVDEPLVEALWPERQALGDRLQILDRERRPEGDPLEVVGVVSGLRQQILDVEPVAHIYVPWGQVYAENMHAHVRLRPGAAGREQTLLQEIREQVGAVDADLPVLSLKTMQHHRDENIELWMLRTAATIFATFGAVALLLAVVGLYGIKAFLVAQRTREIGVRMAMGATRRDVLAMMLREGAVLTGIALTIGLVLSLAVGQLLTRFLFEVSATDPLAFSLSTLLLMGAALLATWLPARRATRVAPSSALRHQ